MLRKFVEENHYNFEEKAENWQDAVRLGCKPLLADNSIDQTYVDAIIECIKKYGPYIIITPRVAMPHAQEGGEGVNSTTISFMRIEQPVSFDPDDPEKDAELFFTLASNNPDEHLENMTALTTILMNQELLDELFEAKSAADLLRLQEKYLD